MMRFTDREAQPSNHPNLDLGLGIILEIKGTRALEMEVAEEDLDQHQVHYFLIELVVKTRSLG